MKNYICNYLATTVSLTSHLTDCVCVWCRVAGGAADDVLRDQGGHQRVGGELDLRAHQQYGYCDIGKVPSITGALRRPPAASLALLPSGTYVYRVRCVVQVSALAVPSDASKDTVLRPTTFKVVEPTVPGRLPLYSTYSN